MTEDKRKMAAKIQALIAKANSTEHEAEAEAFMRKAQALLEEHQINLGEFLDADDPVIVDEDGFKQTQSSPSWYKYLYIAAAELYGCRVCMAPQWIETSRGNKRWGYAVEVTGRQSAIVTAQLMYPWLKQQCVDKGRQIIGDWLARGGKIRSDSNRANEDKKMARRIGNALVSRINLLIAANKKDPATAAGKNALITLDRVLQVFDDHYKDLNLTQTRDSSVETNALAREAAESIGLHRQTGDSSSTLAIGSK